MLRLLLQIAAWPFPWILRRQVFAWMGFRIHKTAYIGRALIAAGEVSIGEGCVVGDLTVVRGLQLLQMDHCSRIGRRNWIVACPTHHGTDIDGKPRSVLHLMQHSAITIGHLIDANARVTIGEFSTIAGYGSQLLTHSIDIRENVQSARPICIGKYSFVGTRSVILGGAELPSFSVLGAGALLNKPFDKSYKVYGGVPAVVVSELPKECKYFNRDSGFVR
ncbi:putative lipopolysaccharide biosynthesis O-acetyl transferase WbbJ [Crateriforma conspicua]|uniref:Putative lipopolysaccharide biosynthesis O-acetyl transferase WbbJ n=1 Tax=Crateriforma conspicua TaxID=2527996 RepID=A0A5C5Y301_9PLAN|nr:putative lipopolysaccharide biosynthesis O-acetyl transferase WbbJ [Crateriforma conspicua]